MCKTDGLTMCLGLALAVMAPVAAPVSAEQATPAPEARLSFFTDPEDARNDPTGLMERGGFIPVPITFTEPAVDGGPGFSGQFIGDAPSARTSIGDAATGMEGHGAGGLRPGGFADGQWPYRSVPGGTLNPGFSFAVRDGGTVQGNELTFAAIHTRHLFGDSGFSLAPRDRYRGDELNADLAGRFPEIEAFLAHEVMPPGLGLHSDGHGDPLSLSIGTNATVQAPDLDDAIGTETDFTSATAFGAWFASRGNWTLSAMAKSDTASAGAPFFMQPAAEIRGLPAARNQGEGVTATEIEVLRQLGPRWGVLGFVGWGHAKGDDDRIFDDGISAEAWGGGVRYEIARKLGVDMGVDLALGPEDTVFYIQFGRAWARDTD